MKGQGGIAWLFARAEKCKGKLVFSVFSALISVVCGIVPYVSAAKIGTMLIEQNQELKAFGFWLILMAAAFAGKVIFHCVSTRFSHVAAFSIIGNIRKQCTEKLSRMPLGDVKRHSDGELKSTLMERIDSVETTLAHIIPEFTSNLVLPVLLAAFIFYTDWKMGFASLITIPLGFFCYFGMMLGYEENFNRTVRAVKNMNDSAVEYIGGIQVIKVFGKSKSSYEKFVAAAKEGAASYIDWMRTCNIFMTLAMCLMPATMLSVLPIGIVKVCHGTLTAPEFVSIILFAIAMVEPLIVAMGYSDDLEQISIIVKEIRNILDNREMVRPATLSEAHSIEKIIENPEVELKNVHFGYQEKEILHGVNMKIPAGSFAAIVGPSGSGKSTIAKLIASLWDVDSGEVDFGGVNVKDIPQSDFNRLVAFVSQENYLFNATVRENIAMGKLDGNATEEEVIQAAKNCGCHDFIMSLEKGYDTVCGTSGGHLSGGERQRITIARAMLKNAPVVILDEATSYTDPESEAEIQESLARLVKGKTLIVIAHRLSTIKDADQIFCISDGMVKEQGTHDELLDLSGLYAKMWAAHISSKDGE